MINDQLTNQDGGKTEVAEAGAPKCPSLDWVHKSLMDEYSQINQNPKTTVELAMTAWGWDFYKLNLDGHHLEVGVDHGNDPRKAENLHDVEEKINGEDTVSDIYKDGQRYKATFRTYDPLTNDQTASGMARFSQDGQKSYVSEMSGGLFSADGNIVRFDSKFDANGKRTEFRTFKPELGTYTPDRCE